MASESITICYGDIAEVATALGKDKATLEYLAGGSRMQGTNYFDVNDQRMGWEAVVAGAGKKLTSAAERLGTLAERLQKVSELCETCERTVKAKLENRVPAEGLGYKPSQNGGGHASEYYGGIDQAKVDEENKKKADEEKLGFFAEHFPMAYAAYMAKLNAEAEEAWLEQLKNSDDPLDRAMYEMIMEQKKREEEAAKAAEEAAKALEEAGAEGAGTGTDSAAGSGLDSDLGGLGGGGGGGLGDLGSDFGGGGGLGDLGSGWEADMLDDALDTGEFSDAAEALDDIASATNPAASDTGLDAVAGAAELDAESAGALGQFGEKLASLASAYGLQAAAVAGAGIALYVTREQTTEAVAYAAEFVSEKCRPFASDVMDQVRGAAKKTRVNVGAAKSRVTAATRDERAGDLIA